VILRLVKSVNQTDTPRVNLHCPACRRETTFDPVGGPDIAFYAGLEESYYKTGERVCGNEECRAHLFVVRYGDSVVATYPPETIDFDSSSLPRRVVAAFEEAVKCHAQQCFVAAAIMVRKTFEEVCADRGATGENLYDRIEALGKKVVLPEAMLDGLHDLRLLGNDAAHLEARVYDEIGKEEVEVAIDVAKEILKATYQLEGIIGRLKALKKSAADENVG
jgi:hypothetical protein